MKKTQIIKYVVISLVTLLVILPFSVATLSIKFPIGKQIEIKEKKTDEQVYQEIIGSLTSKETRDEVIKQLAPLMDFIENPTSAAQKIKNEYGIGIDLTEIVSILEEAREYSNSTNKK